MRGVGSKRKGLLEIKKVGLDGEKWLVSESFGETSTKEKNKKGLGRKRVKVGECWSWLENLKGRGCWSLERCWSTGAKLAL